MDIKDIKDISDIKDIIDIKDIKDVKEIKDRHMMQMEIGKEGQCWRYCTVSF